MGRAVYHHYRELSQAAGAKKPSESQKAKAFWAMKAAWDRCEEFYDPTRKEDFLGRTKTRLELCEEHLKDPMAALAKALECLQNPCQGWHLVSQLVVASLCRRNGFQHRWRKDFAKDVGRALLGRRLAFPGPIGCCGYAHSVQRLERSGEARAA